MAKKVPNGPPRPFIVELNGYHQQWTVDAADEDTAIDKVIADNEAVKLRDRRNFRARLAAAHPQPPAPPNFPVDKAAAPTT